MYPLTENLRPGGHRVLKILSRTQWRRLAKMSFDETHVMNLTGIETLKFTEKTDLEGWIEKFYLLSKLSH
jgi:hypothetical protein